MNWVISARFFDFVFYYPLIMSIVWMFAAIIFYFRRERNSFSSALKEFPLITILIPCFNEQQTIVDTIHELQALDYPKYKIVVINDGSKDRSLSYLSLSRCMTMFALLI
ncbi:glycosyltransferase [Alicyclobacillus tolerans]|uniref:Cellulose synthase/poly-beta-1,6-N-acetylglucosamine synthase-like glycosyltransferase n=1 Tax=Alicyclobacillus tolerans TaxID=90970 RepID=A0ABT9LZ83_9BACL|nr:glycosyltransferase family 2 protein [Alicyclobacillus tengchongensis]MDP9729578.1 cellulose synthase/poly-beta-1,6-N-acetylglucosamine synthase-like glycosyltransferase [Alicyclobacillus tengchongensis]